MLTAVACAVAAAALAVGSLVDSPDELFSGVSQAGQAIIAKADAETLAVPEGKRTFRERLRLFFFGQPSIIRGITLLPLWGIGKVGLTLLSSLFTALNPVWQFILGILLNAALLFGLFALVLKLLFPNKRLRDLLTKRNIILLAGGALLLSIADTVLRIFWDDYRPISIAIKLVIALLILALLSWRIFGKRIRKTVVQPV